MTQQMTRQDNERHSSDTNNNNGNNIIDSSLRSESTHNNSAHEKFLQWLSDNCPYIFKHYKLLSDVELEKLKQKYGSEAIAEECANIENRVDLRKRYSNLYRTLLNWLKKRQDERTATHINGARGFSHGATTTTDEQLVADTYDLINEARARENLDYSF